jgi:hypothetical protein
MDYSEVRLIFPFHASASPEFKLDIISRALSEPLNSFQNFRRWVETLLSDVQESQFVSCLEDPYDDFFDFQVVVTDLVGQNDLLDLFDNPSEPLEQLQRCLRSLLAPDFVASVTDAFPLHAEALVRGLGPELQASFAAIASLVHENAGNAQFLGWVGGAVVPEDWHEKTSGELPALKLCGIFERARQFLSGGGRFWVLVSREGALAMWPVDEAPAGPAALQFDVDHIDLSGSGRSLRVWRAPGEIGARLLVPEQCVRDTWLAREPLTPRSLPFWAPHPPPELAPALRQALVQPDTYVLRAVLAPDVIRVSAALEAVHDLFTVFADAGLVHRFVSTMCAIEFTRPGLSETTLLQSNSHLIFLFRCFFQRFGRPLFERVIRPIIARVVEAGDLGLKDGTDPQVAPVGELLGQAIDALVAGRSQFPDPFLHIGALLSSYTATRFRTRRCVYSAVSNFLCSRFMCAAMTDPSLVDSSFVLHPTHAHVVVPFAQLLQVPFALQPLGERWGNLCALNGDLVGKFETIYNFVMSATVIDHPPSYAKPTSEEVQMALQRLLEKISAGREPFIRKYTDLYENDCDRTASSFAMADLIAKLFR